MRTMIIIVATTRAATTRTRTLGQIKRQMLHFARSRRSSRIGGHGRSHHRLRRRQSAFHGRWRRQRMIRRGGNRRRTHLLWLWHRMFAQRWRATTRTFTIIICAVERERQVRLGHLKGKWLCRLIKHRIKNTVLFKHINQLYGRPKPGKSRFLGFRIFFRIRFWKYRNYWIFFQILTIVKN